MSDFLAGADEAFGKCTHLNSQWSGCFENYSMIYSQAALRTFQSGKDPQPQLTRTFTSYATCLKLGGNYLDAEQHAVLAHWVDAAEHVRRQQDPGPALSEMNTTLVRCLALAAQDALCRTLAAQAEWVAADWLALQKKPPGAALQRALEEAILATQSPEVYPDKWQVLAETRLRLARTESARPVPRERHLTAGLNAVEQVFSINPNHALGRATQGALWLLRAQSTVDPVTRRAAAKAAVTALEQCLHNDPFLTHDNAPLLIQAKALAAAQEPARYRSADKAGYPMHKVREP